MTTENIFEQASKLKVRFEFKGYIAVEDLWDLTLEDLDTIYRKVSMNSKKNENSLLTNRKTKEDKLNELKLEIVTYIFGLKQDEINAQKEAAEKRQKKAKLLEIMDRKQNQELENKTPEEIRAMISALEE